MPHASDAAAVATGVNQTAALSGGATAVTGQTSSFSPFVLSYTATAPPGVPEPGTGLLMLAGLILAATRRRRRGM